MRYNFSAEFANLTNAETNRNVIGPEQRKLLQHWMGRGPAGARAARGGIPPAGLKRQSLRAYHEIARRVIDAENDPRGTQEARIELIEEALDALDQQSGNGEHKP